MGGDRFDPFGVCGAREFITMLYRLTHISEGSDYSWATALEGFVSDVGDLREFRTSGWSLPVAPENFASGLKNWFDQDSPFTREVTADVMYLMLSFNAGPEKESLGDILASEYGMSDILLYDHYVRRTAYDMRGATTLTLENFTGDGKTVTLSIQNGKLVVDDSRKGDMSVDLPSGSVSAGSPITLPGETFPSALRYRDRFLAGYDEDGEPLYGAKGYNEKFTVTYADGEWVVIDNTWDSPLPYEKNPGEGYMCSYDHPELIFEVRAPRDHLEPRAERSVFGSYFNMNYDDFYKDHTLWRQPLYAGKTVLNVNHVLPQ